MEEQHELRSGSQSSQFLSGHRDLALIEMYEVETYWKMFQGEKQQHLISVLKASREAFQVPYSINPGKQQQREWGPHSEGDALDLLSDNRQSIRETSRKDLGFFSPSWGAPLLCRRSFSLCLRYVYAFSPSIKCLSSNCLLYLRQFAVFQILH